MMNDYIIPERSSEKAPDDLIFYNTEQVAKMLGCSVPTARGIFHRRDFPALVIGKNFKVEKHAFERWCSERRSDI